MKYRITVIAGIGLASDGFSLRASDVSEATRRIRDYALRQYTGLSELDGFGYWKCPVSGQVLEERSRTFIVLTDSPLNNPDALPDVHLKYVREQATALAQFIRLAYQQSSVILTIEVLPLFEFVDAATGLLGK